MTQRVVVGSVVFGQPGGVKWADEAAVTRKPASPHQTTREFEAALCEYTGAPYAVAVTSCTMALLLAVAWNIQKARAAWGPLMAGSLKSGEELGAMHVEIPKRTYIGVPYAIIEAGGRPTFRDEDWLGWYQLRPLPVWDSARWLTSGLYPKSWVGSDQMACVSFHATKTLGDSQGGAILHSNPEADAWFRRARFDGRTEGVAPADDQFILGRAWHCYLSPDVANRLLWKLSVLPKHNDPLPNDNYPDLSKIEAFK